MELRKFGIVIKPNLNLLTCYVHVLYQDYSGIVYSLDVVLEEFLWSGRVDRDILVRTWQGGSLGYAPATNLGETFNDLGLDCAEKFGNDWLAANPKR